MSDPDGDDPTDADAEAEDAAADADDDNGDEFARCFVATVDTQPVPPGWMTWQQAVEALLDAKFPGSQEQADLVVLSSGFESEGAPEGAWQEFRAARLARLQAHGVARDILYKAALYRVVTIYVDSGVGVPQALANLFVPGDGRYEDAYTSKAWDGYWDQKKHRAVREDDGLKWLDGKRCLLLAAQVLRWAALGEKRSSIKAVIEPALPNISAILAAVHRAPYQPMRTHIVPMAAALTGTASVSIAALVPSVADAVKNELSIDAHRAVRSGRGYGKSRTIIKNCWDKLTQEEQDELKAMTGGPSRLCARAGLYDPSKEKPVDAHVTAARRVIGLKV